MRDHPVVSTARPVSALPPGATFATLELVPDPVDDEAG